jgi:chromosomal replication initiation ATPase DnaA
MTIHEYTSELIDLIMKTADIEPILRHKIVRRVSTFKPYKDHKYKKLTPLKVLSPRKPNETIDFFKLPIKIQKIILLACEKNDIEVQSFCSNRRKEDIVETQRHVSYFLHKEIKLSSTKIAGWFKKDHSTILHACSTHADYYLTNKLYMKLYDYFKEEALKIISED